jgi:hypothetical protein
MSLFSEGGIIFQRKIVYQNLATKQCMTQKLTFHQKRRQNMPIFLSFEKWRDKIRQKLCILHLLRSHFWYIVVFIISTLPPSMMLLHFLVVLKRTISASLRS